MGVNITECYNVGDLKGVNFTQGVGGIAGSLNQDSNLNNSYNVGKISCEKGAAGGITGYISIMGSNVIENCYNIGEVIIDSDVSCVGGIAGENIENEIPVNCYYLDSINIIGGEKNDIGTPVSSEYMKTQEFYNQLNVDNVWIYRKESYPKLNTGIPIKVEEVTNINIENTLKKFNITTEIGLNSENSRTGGSITGEYTENYLERDNVKFVETIKYNCDSKRGINIDPDDNYVIKEIKINGETLDFAINNDGSYIISEGYFKEVKEDYHIVVIFEKISDTLILNKVDSNDNTKLLPGAKFKIEQIEDRPQVTNEVGSITNNGTYYFTNSNGKYVSNNTGEKNTVANSYITINLSGRTGKYTLTVNAEISSESGRDIGYATVTKDTSTPAYNSTTGRFIYISGTESAKNYETVLEAGYKYYLHLGYTKNGSVNTGTDTFTVNSVKLSLNTDDFYTGELTTNANGQIVEKVPLGKYRITELEAPDGYALLSKPTEVTLSAGKCNVTIVNEKTENYVITKIDKETNKPLKGAKFAIYSLAETYEIEDFIKNRFGNYIGEKNADGIYLISTDENGRIELSLAPGLYKAVEVVSPEGYVLEESEMERTTFFEIENTTDSSSTDESTTQINYTNINNTDVSDADVVINNIEDLVRLSDSVNSGTSYEGKTIKLARTLDFNEDSSYNDPADTSFGDYNGDGSTEGIKAELTNQAGKGFKPIGWNISFKGTFDGNNNEIRNLYINNSLYSVGLFGKIEYAEIRNLGITGNIKYSSAAMGGIAGHADNSIIRNCYNKATITGGTVGGIIGNANNLTIEDCHNEGVISGTSSNSGYSATSGIIGYMSNGKVINCYNEGEIYGGGGIVGYVEYNGNAFLIDCINVGTINGENFRSAGGIIGSEICNVKIENCYNTGDIKGNGQSVGGISGNSVTNSIISNCYNVGVLQNNSNSSSSYTGGIVGSSVTNSKISNCYNKGIINSTNAIAGGIVGNNVTDSTVLNSYNEGEVSTSGPAGGIVGSSVTNSKISSCYNKGIINSTNAIAGGIVGNNVTNSAVLNSYNEGKVSASGPAGGIVAYMSGSKIINYYNTGVINSTGSTAGGLVASISSSKILNSYNTGNVNASVPAGGLAQSISGSEITNFYNTGIITGNYGIGGIAQSSSNNIMNNCYYLDSSAPQGIYNQEDIQGQVEAKTQEELQSEQFVQRLNLNKNSVSSDFILFNWQYVENSYPTLEQIQFKKERNITITNEKEKDNLIINKIDKDTGKKLAGAKFRLESSTNKANLIGNIESNSQYKFSKYGLSGYQSDNYNISNSVANAYFPIDLSEYEGTFKLTVNYTISSQSNYDYGYATITTSTDVPTYNQDNWDNNIKRFIYTSGSYSDQTSSINLTGGQKYYLHIGYRKDGSTDTENDRFYINSMKLTYSAEVETNGDGIGSVKVPTGVYTITETKAPVGYELNSTSQTVEIFNSIQVSELTFENTKQEGDIHNPNFILTKKDKLTDEIMPGVKFMLLDEQGNYAKDYTGTIVGEKEEIDGEEKYAVATDINGQVKLKLNIGKYKLVEVKTLDGYALEDEKEFEITNENESTTLEMTITNQKAGRVIVHHYLEGTGSEFGNEPVILAEDETLEGKVPEEYITSPNMKIEGYGLIKDERGEYVIPQNASGTYTEEEQNVYYYYNRKPLELIVHHYLEGTENKVHLGQNEQGEDIVAEDEHYYYKEGEHYKTNASEEVLKLYELVEVVGDEEKDITQDEVVTYYYRIKKHEITTRIEIPEGRTEDEKGGQISGEGETPYETVEHEKTSTKDIKITPDKGYRIKQIRLISTNEEGVKKESIIYGENKTENTEITYTENVDNSVTLTKFENMTEDKEVIVVFEPDEGRIIVHHYIENTQEKIYEDQITVGLVGQKVETSPVKVEDYIVVQEPEDRNATITQETQEKVYYYQRQYKITTDVIEHDETYKNGEVRKNVKGGSITSEDEVAHEYVLKGRASQNDIIIVPSKVTDENREIIEEYEIVKVVIKDGTEDEVGKIYDFKDKLEDDGSLILKAGEDGIFPDMQSDKHVEVEFRKKTRVIVKHLEIGTEKVLYTTEDGNDYEEIDGYEGKGFETFRKVIANYKAAELGITDENKVETESSGVMFADEITIIYWYEKVPSGILVKHVEKITNKTINEETGKEEITVTGVVLDEEVIHGYAGNTETTNRKNFENYISAENKDATEGINVGKDENSKTVIMKQDEVVEVVYWYEREFNITTNVIEHTEKVVNSETGEEQIVNVKGGSISGEDETPYEKVIRSNDSTKEIKIVPDDGYRIKKLSINGMEIYVEDKVAEDGSLVLDTFTNMQQDKLVEVEFEKIPAKVIVKYIDKYTKESVAKDKIIDGYVNEQYDEKRIEVDGYVPTEPEPENSNGNMTKDVITVVYYYTKEFKITTDVKEHLEDKEKNVVEVVVDKVHEIIQNAGTSGDDSDGTTQGSEDNANGKPNTGNTAHDILTPINPDEIPDGKIAVKGGTITGEDETPYESVLRGENSKKQIKIIPDEGYRIKYLAIKDGGIEYTLPIEGLLTKENTIILPEEYFKNVQADKHIVVEFEPIPAKVVVNYLDIETKGNEETKEVAKQEIGEGFVNYEYKTHEKEIPYYELVKEELPENAEGKLTKEDTIVNYWYRKLLFNMKITKEFSSIKVNGNEILGDDKKFVKVDIANTDVANTNISVKYKLAVTNTEEIEGNATIVEHIPAGFKLSTQVVKENSVVEAENSRITETWQDKDGEITLTTRNLKPGETAEYEVELEWDKSLNCVGLLVNTAIITQTKNIPEFTETKPEDNIDSCTLLLSIRTNENRNVKTIISILCFVLAGLCTIVYIVNEVKSRKNSEK